MRRVILSAVAVLSFLSLCAQTPVREHHTMKHQGLEREYYLYVPDSLDSHRPLVVMLHGFGGKADGYLPEMSETARKHGFALCVPKGWPSPVGNKPGWNVRYPKQEGQVSDDVKFVKDLCRKLQKQYGLNPDATFLTGMSNGGEMCYVFAWQHPETFKAIASVSGLTMEWLVKETPLPQIPVPFLEFHGTEDHTSEWAGDPDGKYGWGPYLAVPVAVGNIVAINRCTCEEVYELPLKSAQSHKVIVHRYLDGAPVGLAVGSKAAKKAAAGVKSGSAAKKAATGVKAGAAAAVKPSEVRLYEIVGGKHSWALKDLDTTEEIWNFFAQWLD